MDARCRLISPQRFQRPDQLLSRSLAVNHGVIDSGPAMLEFSPARLAVATDLPRGSGWSYEPKFDGYRCLLGTDLHGRPFALSRNRKDLARYFPELLRLAEGLPAGSVVDGEAVKSTPEGVSFVQLQRRLMLPIRDRAAESRRAPAALVAFDLLSDGREDVRSLRLSERRRRLERVVKAAATSLMQLVVQVWRTTWRVIRSSVPGRASPSVAGCEGSGAPPNHGRRSAKASPSSTPSAQPSGAGGPGRDCGPPVRRSGVAHPISAIASRARAPDRSARPRGIVQPRDRRAPLPIPRTTTRPRWCG